MEIQFHMNLKMERMVPLIYKAMTYKVRSISCMDRKVAMQGKSTTNFYEVLSLGSEKVGFEEIKAAYRAMALQCHPDVCPDPMAKEESTRRFVELREAYETLSDPVSRRNYDYELGLVDSLGFGGQEKRASFPKDVWERQLSGLRRRSGDRMERRKNGL